MRALLFLAVLVLAILFATGLAASGLLAGALGLGWLARRFLPLDFFQATMLALVATAAGAAFVLRLVRDVGSALLSSDAAAEDDDVEGTAVDNSAAHGSIVTAARSSIERVVHVVDFESMRPQRTPARRRRRPRD